MCLFVVGQSPVHGLSLWLIGCTLALSVMYSVLQLQLPLVALYKFYAFNAFTFMHVERRLKTCEECFHKSYGANLERLTVIKGGSGMEAALFVRLHLLQAVVAFYQRRYDQVHNLLTKVDDGVTCLH